MVTERKELYLAGKEAFPSPLAGEVGRIAAGWGEPSLLARSPPSGSEALDLPCLRGRYVVRAPSHLAHESLFLHLAAELAQRLLELFGILDDYSHNPSRIQAGEFGPLC